MRFFEAPPEDFHGKLPFVLTDLITELRRRNSHEVEGIFRLNGSDTDIRRLMDELNKGRIADWSKYEDIHVISCALKRYFRVMSEREPIIPNEICPCLVVTMDLGSQNEFFVQQQRQLMTKLIAMLPRIRALTLGYLISYLHELSLSSGVNRMTPSNLGICFGPNFVGDGALDPETAMHDQQAVNSGIAMMIDNFQEIFAGLEFPDDLIMTDDDFQELLRPPVNLRHVQHQMFRCQFRHGRVIPFVPICRLMQEWQPPQRSPQEHGQEDADEQLPSFLGSMDSMEEFTSMLRTKTGRHFAKFRASVALASDFLQPTPQ
jgi:hypothetical protein